MIEKLIVLEDIDPVIFYGVNNANIQLIKALYPKLRIVARGNVIKVLGDEEEMCAFEENITKLEKYCAEYNSLKEEVIIDIIKGKWRTSILLALADGPVFFASLQRCLPGISAKVLTENLHVFERNGLITRTVHATVPPTVAYSLTDRGEKLIRVMQGINGWVDSFFVNL